MKICQSNSLRLQTLSLVILCAIATLVQAAVPPSVSTLPRLGVNLRAPTRVATDKSGNVYVVDSAGGRVLVMDAFNRVVSEVTGFRTPLGIAVDDVGNIYLGEAGNGSVSVFGPQWNLLQQLGQGVNEFMMPGHITVDSDAGTVTVYVSDAMAHEIKAYQNGTLVNRFGHFGSGAGGFNFPAGLWMSPAGEMFVVDQNNDRVQVFNRAGVFQRAFTLAPPDFGGGRSGRAQGIVGDSLGRIYVADTFQDNVKVFDAQGVFLSEFSGYGEAAGGLRSPAGLALDAAGRLYVASPNNGRVEVFGLDCFTQLAATPASRVASVGATVTFSALTSCDGPFTFQWRKGTNDLIDGGIIAGATNAILTLTGVAAGDAGGYSVVLTGPNGAALSPEAQLIITAAPVIVSSPGSRSASEGSMVTFSVGATGAGLTYRWFFNGIELLAPNSNMLVVSNLQPSDAGKYWAVVTNSAGSATSAQATLAVNLLPRIIVAPMSQTVAERDNVTFSVVGNGTAPLAYQWFRGASALSGQTRTTLVLSNTTPAVNGSYYVRVSNVAGLTNSVPVTLTVIPDTVPPAALAADGGYATNTTILLSFSKALNVSLAQQTARYQLLGLGNRAIISAVVTNSSNVLLRLNGARVAGANYALRVSDIRDSTYSANLLSPNPTTLAVASRVELIGINSTAWRYREINAGLDGQPWKLPTYSDNTWSNGFGIFFGHRSNSVYQPNPNPNVHPPITLDSANPATTKAYTILNVFTNAGNVVQENTYYFRTTFNFAAETNGAALFLRSMIDDGAVLYLNGQESLRVRMPATTITYNTLASSSGSQSWSPAFTSSSQAFSLAGLKQGTNLLAIEVHQNSTTSTDITMGLLLEASVQKFPTPTPTLATSRNANGDLILSWSDPFYVLESAADPAGPWTSLGSGTSLTIPASVMLDVPAQFFRLKKQ